MKSLLAPLTPIYISAINLRNWAFEKKLIPSVQLKIPVISVGNITMGGTGKTPFIHWLLQEVKDLGYRPGVICRNYRASSSQPSWVHTEPGSYKQFGDEAVFLKLKNPMVPILSGPRKWENALQMESENSEVNTVLVDDGFQHRRLRRNLDIVLLDVSVSPSDYAWPPFGRARESLVELKRADVIVLSRWEQRDQKTVDFLNQHIPSSCIQLQAEQIVESPNWIAGTPWHQNRDIKKARVVAFCGLGNPTSFFKSLEQMELNIKDKIIFPDHTDYREPQVQKLIAASENSDFLITSEKDSVKLQNWPFHGPTLCVTSMRLKVTGPLEAFRETLARNLWTNS